MLPPENKTPKNSKKYSVPFVVFNGDRVPILGYRTSLQMNLITVDTTISTSHLSPSLKLLSTQLCLMATKDPCLVRKDLSTTQKLNQISWLSEHPHLSTPSYRKSLGNWMQRLAKQTRSPACSHINLRRIKK